MDRCEVVIVEALRTLVGKRDGVLRDYQPVELGALVLRELLARAHASSRMLWQARAPMRGWAMAAHATRHRGMQAAGILLVPRAWRG